jgi:putative Mg2+ transporter-C (MgtC) family protein
VPRLTHHPDRSTRCAAHGGASRPAIGFEREIANRPAGLRTHILVAAVATLLVSVGDAVVAKFGETMHAPIRSDPLRTIEAVITGVSFPGAGTIIRRHGEGVQGLTTAASLLLTAGIGISVAASRFALATGVTVLVLFTLHVLNVVEHRWAPSSADGSGESGGDPGPRRNRR